MWNIAKRRTKAMVHTLMFYMILIVLLSSILSGCGEESVVTQPTTLASPGTLKWKCQIGGTVRAPAIYSDGTIYVNSENNLYAVSPDGIVKWMIALDKPHGIVVDQEGYLYVCSGQYACWEFATCSQYMSRIDGKGSLNKQYELQRCSGIAVDVDGTLYITTSQPTMNSSTEYLYALNRDGSVKWRFTTDYKMPEPVVDTRRKTIYLASGPYLYAIRFDGSLKWKYKAEGALFAPPAIGSDGSLYGGTYYGNVYALSSSGHPRWTYEIGRSSSIECSPSIGVDGTIYVSSDDGNLYAFSANGALKWKYQTGRSKSPTIGADGMIYFGSYDKNLYALNPDGTFNWKYEAGGYLVSAPAIGDDGTIYVGSGDGYLYALNSISLGLANSPWPKYQHDNRNTGASGTLIH
jgi:outer membrane protein assembly factor BamB